MRGSDKAVAVVLYEITDCRTNPKQAPQYLPHNKKQLSTGRRSGGWLRPRMVRKDFPKVGRCRRDWYVPWIQDR